MKYLIVIFIFISADSFAQNSNSAHSPEDIYWASLKLLNYKYICGLKDGTLWYIDPSLKDSTPTWKICFVVVYLPSFTYVNNITYKNVSIDEYLLIDCSKLEYKILSANYYYNYLTKFDSLKYSYTPFDTAPINSPYYKIIKSSCPN